MQTARTIKPDTLHAVLNAISHGDLAAARALLAPSPPALEAVAPGLKEVEAGVQAAHELYLEALRARAEVLRRVKERIGPGPFLSDGKPVQIVARVRGEQEQLFLRAMR